MRNYTGDYEVITCMTENIRTEISIHLTRILVLFGRLGPDQNPRQLPATLASIEPLIRDLEEMKDAHRDFSIVLHESIDIREKYSKVFRIPPVMLADRSLEGIRSAMCQLATRLVGAYCREEKKFLTGELLRDTAKEELLRTMKACTFMAAICPDERDRLEELQQWCEQELAKL